MVAYREHGQKLHLPRDHNGRDGEPSRRHSIANLPLPGQKTMRCTVSSFDNGAIARNRSKLSTWALPKAEIGKAESRNYPNKS